MRMAVQAAQPTQDARAVLMSVGVLTGSVVVPLARISGMIMIILCSLDISRPLRRVKFKIFR